MSGRATLIQTKTKAEGSVFVNSFLSEITQSKGVGPTVARAAFASKTTDGVVDLDADEEPPTSPTRRRSRSSARATSASSGFTGHDHRLTVEELEELHPGLVAAVAAHPGVAMLMVRSTEFGAVVFGPKGTRFLDQDRVEGEDPTTLFGPHTIMSLKREDAMVHAPDLLLLSQYDPELGEVAAFEELIGSHGGLGGPQTEPFILHPTEWTARRGRAARRTGHLPQHPALARVDRDRAREAPAGDSGRGRRGASGVGPAAVPNVPVSVVKD